MISRPETRLQINQLRVLKIALVNHNKCQGLGHCAHTQHHHLEWKLMLPVKTGDNILKQHVYFGIQRGLWLYFRQQ